MPDEQIADYINKSRQNHKRILIILISIAGIIIISSIIWIYVPQISNLFVGKNDILNRPALTTTLKIPEGAVGRYENVSFGVMWTNENEALIALWKDNSNIDFGNKRVKNGSIFQVENYQIKVINVSGFVTLQIIK